MLIDIIAGARPNFMKIAPIIEAIKASTILDFRLIHTGQHYDPNMSGNFFDELGIPMPDINLGAGGGTQAEQTATIMVGYEKVLMESPSDLCLVVGDVTSTMACSIVAKKMHIKVAHVEAGIRSGDMTMPEEINRMVTDSITDFFFTTSETANQKLRESGVAKGNIFFVGNTMIDTLLKNRSHFIQPEFWSEQALGKGNYWVLTLHRPANVDEAGNLADLLTEIRVNAKKPVVFPVHPRTRQMLEKLNWDSTGVYLCEPLSYLRFNYLAENAIGVITDSGGITEETTVMGVPCMTLRDNTERPETITEGTNELIGTNPLAIAPAMKKILNGQWKTGKIPHLWDGMTAGRIIEILEDKLT